MTRKAKSSVQPRLESLEARDLMSISPGLELVGVVRDGTDWFLAGDRTSSLAEQVRRFGPAGSQYLSGDWDRNGRADLVVVSGTPQGGLSWQIDLDGDLKANVVHSFGLVGDKAFLGDWNGDGTIDVGVARKNAQTGGIDWYLDTTRVPFANPRARQFGLFADTPVVGDWDGNGTTDVGVTRPDPSVGLLQWHLDTSGDLWPEVSRHFGLLGSNDVPITGDWDRNGKTDLGVTRNNTATGLKEWHLDTNGDKYADISQAFGFARDIAVVGAWKALAPVAPPVEPLRPPAVSPPSAPPTPPTVQKPSTALINAGIKLWDTQEAISGARVQLLDDRGRVLRTASSQNGTVSFAPVSSGLYKITATFSRNGKDYYGQVEFAGPRVSKDLQLQEVVRPYAAAPTGGRSHMTATVLDARDTRIKIGGASVRLTRTGAVVAEYVSNAQGLVAFWGLPRGDYAVEVRVNGQLLARQSKSLSGLGHGSNDNWSPLLRVTRPAPPRPPPAPPTPPTNASWLSAAISVAGGTIVRSTYADVGNLRVYVAQVQVSGATSNNIRIYVGIINRTTGRPVRSNLLVSDDNFFGNRYLPSIGVLTGGRVVIAWNAIGLGGNNNRIFYRLLEPNSGGFVTAVAQANNPASNTHNIGVTRVKANANGTFTIGWTDYSDYTTWAADFASNGVKVRQDYRTGFLTR